MSKKAYRIETKYITQPVYHGDKSAGTFQQRVKLVVPEPCGKITKVLYLIGHESALADKWLLAPFKAFGQRDDMVVLGAEHRGYGISVTENDQTLPSYVSMKQALADYHNVCLAYKERFPCQWLIYGCSYGGGLVINYAHDYPQDAKVAICSSGVTDWNVMLPEYDEVVRENLGDELYERLCHHIDVLSPAKPFDTNWVAREKIYAVVTALTQFREYRSLFNVINATSKLSTKALMSSINLIDSLFAKHELNDYAMSNCTQALTAEQARTGNYAWRVWRYQQAFHTGTFWAPSSSRSIYRRSQEDWAKETELVFGKKGTVFVSGTDWDVRKMVNELKIPLIYVRGGRDPWRNVGLEKDFPIANGKIITIEDGYHGPERYSDTGPAIFEEALKYLG